MTPTLHRALDDIDLVVFDKDGTLISFDALWAGWARAIGTRLEVSDDDDSSELYALPDEDPRKPMVMAYLWLGGLQETLVETLLP